MAATAVERLAEEAMTNAELEAWLAALGLGRRMVIYYAKDRTIPRYIALACRGYEATSSERAE